MSGWYEAEVQSFDYHDKEIELVYADEPGCVYRMALCLCIRTSSSQTDNPLKQHEIFFDNIVIRQYSYPFIW